MTVRPTPGRPAVRGPALLLTGRTVAIAPASPDDLDEVRDFYARLGDASTRFRFFGIRRHVPDAELRAVVGASARHVTLLARLGGELIGIGEHIVGNDPTEAEVAFAVADDHHHEGVATLLLERLAVIAHERGVRTFTAMVLPDNHDMQLVFATVGLPVRTCFVDGVLTTVLELTSLASLEAAARRRASHAVAALAG